MMPSWFRSCWNAVSSSCSAHVGARHHARRIARPVAAAVGVPHDVLVVGAELPGHLIAPRRSAPPRPASMPRTGHRYTPPPRPSATGPPRRRHAGRTGYRPVPGPSRQTSRASWSSARSGHCRSDPAGTPSPAGCSATLDPDTTPVRIARPVAAAVGVPHDVLVVGAELPGHLIAPRRLLRPATGVHAPNWPSKYTLHPRVLQQTGPPRRRHAGRTGYRPVPGPSRPNVSSVVVVGPIWPLPFRSCWNAVSSSWNSATLDPDTTPVA